NALTNDIPTVPRVTLSLYADDAFFVCRSAAPWLARNTMQRQLDALSPWLEKWRIAVNADKSKAICFRKPRRMPRQLPDPLDLDGEDIDWTPQAK
ncbi:reverse transcriptase domain-containing protein, partial [Klebsiella pneumoniae]|uniref:reverse transcriptase domain-containing protein n=1 Tax=Klebsiella pneumoniae TaxID=573 RepID=UPI001179F565